MTGPIRAPTLAQAVAALGGADLRVTGKSPVYGGDSNETYRLALSDGSAVFLKCNAPANLSFFEAEAAGLAALRAAGTIGVPRALALGTDAAMGRSYLLLEYLCPAPKIRGYWAVFGRELAALHRADCTAFAAADKGLPFGFGANNYIGASPQDNAPGESWVDFFRQRRLLPQMRRAEGYWDAATRRRCTALLDHLDRYLCEPAFPSLLHGDLWSGNAVCGPDGKAWILDPAAYVGHFEAELAMTELFGAFPAEFYAAYHEVNPIDKAYRDRRELYNLYHLLNHLNLFGGSYLGAVRRVLERYG